MVGERLFYPHPVLPGILKCAKCDALFITATWLRALRLELKAESRPTRWIPKQNTEVERRRQHAQNHVKRCEATYADDGYFRLPYVAPAQTTARDFGFTGFTR
jgi:hypothetical protein